MKTRNFAFKMMNFAGCAAIVPVVMDLLNLAENTDHRYFIFKNCILHIL